MTGPKLKYALIFKCLFPRVSRVHVQVSKHCFTPLMTKKGEEGQKSLTRPGGSWQCVDFRPLFLSSFVPIQVHFEHIFSIANGSGAPSLF